MREEDVAGLNAKTAGRSKAMKAKDRVTVVACCNTTCLLKVPIAVISSARNSVVFLHVRKLSTPYVAQRSAWVDSSICQRWFDEVFVPFVESKAGRAEILLWDNCPRHIITNNNLQIIIIFLPPNVLSVYQSMDMGILRVPKC